MEYLILMTGAGSALFVSYLCWGKLCGRSVTQSMKYKALIMIMLVYAIPWVWLRRVYSSVLQLFLPSSTIDNELPISIADIKTETQEAYKTQDYQWMRVIVWVWIAVAIVFVLVKVIKYFCKRHYWLSAAVKCMDDEPMKIVNRLQEELGYKHKPEIFFLPGGNVTFTLGGIKPTIFLQEVYEDNELVMILKHEMIHIIRRDILLKTLMHFVCCLHWFNPLIYVLKYQFELICETSCDERAVAGCDKDERATYAKAVVKSMDVRRQKLELGSAFGNGYKNAKERVDIIMNTNKVKFLGKVAAASVFALLLFVDSLTALAYPEVYHMEDTSVEIAEATIDGDTFWTYEETEDSHNIVEEKILYDEQFVDEAGEIYPVNSNGAKVICFNHNIVSGYLQTHVKNDDGSCVVKSYESTRCTKCNTIWVGDLSRTITYDPCLHE